MSQVKEIADGTLIETAYADEIRVVNILYGQIRLAVTRNRGGTEILTLNPWAAGMLSDALLAARERSLNPQKRDQEFTPEERAHIRKYLGI